jgi:hypothetical protein
MSLEVDVWVRGTLHAKTYRIDSLPDDPSTWGEREVRTLLTEMLLALEREKNPGGEPPPVTLRGFSWIVSPYERGGVLVHLEMQMGTASAGPLAIDEAVLTGMLSRIMSRVTDNSTIH